MDLRVQPKPEVTIHPANKGIVSWKEYFADRIIQEVGDHSFPCRLIRKWRPKPRLIHPAIHDENNISYQYDMNREVFNFFFEDDAEETFLRTPPPCVLIVGKPSAKVNVLARQVADFYNSVLIDTKEVIGDVISAEDEIGQLLDRILKTAGCLTINAIMALLSYRAHSARARHRGYVLVGLPCLSTVEDIEVEHQLNYLLLWENRPNIFIHVVNGDEEIIEERLRTGYKLVGSKWESFPLRAETEEPVEEEEDELLPIKPPAVAEKDIGVEPSQPFLKLDVDDASQVCCELELFQQRVKRVIDLFQSRIDPQFFLTVDARVGNQFDIVREKLSMLPVWKSPEAVPLTAVNGESTQEEGDVELSELPVQEAFLTTFLTKNIVSPKFLNELSHFNYICPVAYKNGETTIGKSEFAVSFMKYVYFMRDKEAMLQFLENPRYYLVPVKPRPLVRAIVLGYPFSGKSNLARNLSWELGVPLIDFVDVIERDKTEKRETYKQFCRQRAAARELIRLTAMAWQAWREEENERVTLIEEWIEYVQGLLLQRIESIKKAMSTATDKTSDERQIMSYLPEDAGESAESTFRSKSQKSALEIRGAYVSNPYDGEYAPGNDTFSTPSEKIIQAMRHENYEFNANGLEVEANLFFSVLWSNFASGESREQEREMVEEPEIEEESVGSETTSSINWASFLPPQSLSSLLLTTVEAPSEKRKSFSVLLTAARKASLDAPALKAEFVKWRLPGFMDAGLCKKYYENPLLLIRYCPVWLKERPPMPDPIDLTHPDVIEAGNLAYMKAGIVSVSHTDEEMGLLLCVALEKAERDGTRFTGEIVNRGGWVVDNMPLTDTVWRMLRENFRPNHVYFLMDEDPDFGRILGKWLRTYPESVPEEKTDELVDEDSKSEDNERVKTSFDLASDENPEDDSSRSSVMQEIADILVDSLNFITLGDKNLDKIYMDAIKENGEDYYLSSAMVRESQSLTQASARVSREVRNDVSGSMECPSNFPFLMERFATRGSFHTFIPDKFPVGPQLEKIPDRFLKAPKLKKASAETRKVPVAEFCRVILDPYLELLKTVHRLNVVKASLEDSDCNVHEIFINGKSSDDIWAIVLNELYGKIGKRPRELEPFERERITEMYEAEESIAGGQKKEEFLWELRGEHGEDREDVRIFGESGRFCVVNLERCILLEGKPEFMLKYDGKLYTFWSEEAKEEFMKTPEKYAPYYSVIRSLPPLRICFVGATGCGKSTLAFSLAHHLGLCSVDYLKFMNDRLLPEYPKPVHKFTVLEERNLLLSDGRNEAARRAFRTFMKLPSNIRHFWLDNPSFSEEDEEQDMAYSLAMLKNENELVDVTEMGFLDFDVSSNFGKTETILREYVVTGSPLTEELVELNFKALWTEEPYTSRGFVVDEFPFRISDVPYLQKYRWYPDIFFEFVLPEDEAIHRSLAKVMLEWESKLRKEVAEEQRLENVLVAIREWFVEARRKELMLEHRFKSYREDDGEGLFYGEGDEHFVEPTVDDVLLREYPPLEFKPIFESYEEGSARARSQLTDNYTKELKYVDEIKEEFDEIGTQWHLVDSYNSYVRNFIDLIRVSDSLKKRRYQRCEHAFRMDPAKAEELLERGYYFLSSFGRRCPVQAFKMRNPIHMYEPYHDRGMVYPIAYRNYLYFVSGENEARKFIRNPIKFVFNERLLPHCPLRIAVIGPPKSGKTRLATRLAEAFALKVITMGAAIRFVLTKMADTRLAAMMEAYLRRGCFLPLSLKMEAVTAAFNDPKCASRGFVLDGFPYDAATAEHLAERGKLPFVILGLRATSEFAKKNRQKLDVGNFRLKMKQRVDLDAKYTEWQEDYRKFALWNQQTYGNLYEVDATRSHSEIFYSAYEIIKNSYNGILHYIRHCVTDRALALRFLCIGPHEFDSRKSALDRNCPVCWTESVVLNSPVNGVPPQNGMVQYLEHFYWVCPEHMVKFLEKPDRYLPPHAPPPPLILPKVAEKGAEVAQGLPVYGFGRCTVTRRDYPCSVDWKGSREFVVEYSGKIYFFRSDAMMRRFLARPWRYDTVDVEFEANSNDKTEVIEGLGPPKLASLPPIGFLEQTVAQAIHSSLSVVGELRPIYPDFTPSCTGCIFIALLLKQSANCSESILVKRYLQFMYKNCSATRHARSTFDRAAAYDWMVEDLDEEAEMSEVSSTSSSERLGSSSRQNIPGEEASPDFCWLELDAQITKHNIWNAAFINPKYPKLILTENGELRDMPQLLKYRIVLKYQTYCVRPMPLPPVRNCLNYLYTPRHALELPDAFDYRSLPQPLLYDIYEKPSSTVARSKELHPKSKNVNMRLSAKLKGYGEPADSCQPIFEVGAIDPYMDYMLRHYIPRFHIFDPLPYVEIPAVPRALEDNIELYNPQRDYTYCLLFAQYFRLTHYLRRIAIDMDIEVMEYLSILDRGLGLSDVRSTFFFPVRVTESTLSRGSMQASYQNVFDTGSTYFVPEETESKMKSPRSEDSSYWEWGPSEMGGAGEEYAELFEINYTLARDDQPLVILREVLPYPPLPWETVCRPYYTYCSVPAIFSIPEVEDVTHEKNLSLLDGIIEPTEEFRLLRFPTWVEKGKEDNEDLQGAPEEKVSCPTLLTTLQQIRPTYFYYEFFDFHWSNLITYPFTWAYNMDLKENWETQTPIEEERSIGEPHLFVNVARTWPPCDGHGVLQRVRFSFQIQCLQDVFVDDIAVGTEHTLVLSSNGDVYGWGSNADAQLGLGHTGFVKEPQLIKSLSNRNIKQISTGRTHSAAWTTPPLPRTQCAQGGMVLGLPSSIPLQYEHLQGIRSEAIQGRLRILHQFSDMIYNHWRLLPLTSQRENCKISECLSTSHLRAILSFRASVIPMIRSISRTMVQGRNFGPQVLVRRLSTKGKKCKPIFYQVAKQVVKMKPAELRLPSRAWKVKLVGEGADDVGGVFDDTITDMCQELTVGDVDLLIQTPNAKNETGFNRDRFILNPNHSQLSDFKFLGILFGVAIRTKKPLAIALAPFVWKLLVGESVTIDDLEEIDSLYTQSLRGIRDIHLSGVTGANFHEVIPLECFETSDSSGKFVPIVPGGRNIPLTFENRHQYVEYALKFRLQEMNLQVAAMREGMAWIIPVPLLSLITFQRMEQLVCGMTHISIDLLKKAARYRELEENHELVQWLWSILESFTAAERVLFMRFVSGRSRLPANLADLSQRFQIMKVDRAKDGLPTAQTCFFQLRLPPYSSREVMAEQLRYAINNCHSIDMDNYMLARNTDQVPPSDEEY